jgi:hypothetical protein
VEDRCHYAGEVQPLDQAIASFDRIRTPTELRVYEDEFHPLGGVAAEVFRLTAEWLQRAINGEPAETGRDVHHYVQAAGPRPTAPPARLVAPAA